MSYLNRGVKQEKRAATQKRKQDALFHKSCLHITKVNPEKNIRLDPVTIELIPQSQEASLYLTVPFLDAVDYGRFNNLNRGFRKHETPLKKFAGKLIDEMQNGISVEVLEIFNDAQSMCYRDGQEQETEPHDSASYEAKSVSYI